MLRKKLFLSFIFIVVVAMLTTYFCNKAIVDSASGKLYSDSKSIPYNKVGLLLGTSKYMKSGSVNPYYAFRIEAAVKLIKDSRVKYIIVSGDNGHVEYNEPEQMRSDLMKEGIDSSRIFLDYAGFRTFDSMIRLKEIFNQDSVTIISQQFHNERAIYTASRLGIMSIGFNATDVNTMQGLKTQIREKLARVKVFLDFLLGKKSKFLGSKVNIPE